MSALVTRRVLDHARAYAEAGLPPLPIPPREKGPRVTGWPDLRIAPADVPAHFSEEGNVGGLTGTASGFCDVDLDAPEARALAPIFLPSTEMVHGREGSPRSHYWYRCVAGRLQLKDPTRASNDKPDIVDVRGDGCQTLLPPSVHPNGEVLRWEVSALKPATVTEADLHVAAKRLAAAALLARHWQTPRAECSLALCGALVRAGWDDDAIVHFVAAVSACVNGDDGEPRKRQEHVRRARERLAAGEPVTGLPKLIELGVNKRVIGAVAQWLGLPTSDSSPHLTAVVVETVSPTFAAVAAGAVLDPSRPLRRRLTEVAAQERPPVRSYPTGLAALDRLLGGGVSTRQLLIICAPPGWGKSAFAVWLARVWLARVLGIPVLYVSTELEADEITARVAAQVLGAPWRDIVRGRVAASEVQRAVAGVPIEVIGCDVLPRGPEALAVIEREARAMAAGGTPPLVIVDYVQDLARGGDERTVRGRVGDIASGLRALSQAIDCPVVGVSSVSRTFYAPQKAEALRAADDATVYLATAKESGDVDYAAAVVLAIDLDRESGLARLAVAKSRHGETGFAGARFHGATGRWEPCEGAQVALAGNGRQERRQSAQAAGDDAKVLEAIRKHGPTMAWRELRTVTGLELTRTDKARARLLEGGKIAQVSLPHPRTRQLQPRWVLADHPAVAEERAG
jgi:hypothetical protein